jgi:AcrR family transcriptional regulator
MDIKDKIIEASLALFLKNGIKKMTVQNLVKEMDLSTKTVYKYFEDKEDLLKQCLVVHYKAMGNKVSSLEFNAPNPVVGLINLWHGALELDFGVNHVFYHDLNYYYPTLQDLIIKKTFSKTSSILKKFIEAGIKGGYFRKEIHPLMMIAVMETLYTAITRSENFKHTKLGPDEILKNSMELFIRGHCTEKGLKAIEKFYQ